MIRIFIPTYNPDPIALRKTLQSLYCGVMPTPVEVCVVDNCSTPDIRGILAEYPVKMIENPANIGRIPNWNKCLDVFREVAEDGDLMKFLFVGDTLEPECLKNQYLISQRGFDIVSSAHTVHPVGKDSYVMNHFPDGDGILTRKEALILSKAIGNWLAGCMACPMFSKKLLGDVRFDESMSWASDWKFWTDLMARAKSIYYSAKPAVNFNAQFRAHFLATQHAIQNKEENYMRAYLEELTIS